MRSRGGSSDKEKINYWWMFYGVLLSDQFRVTQHKGQTFMNGDPPNYPPPSMWTHSPSCHHQSQSFPFRLFPAGDGTAGFPVDARWDTENQMGRAAAEAAFFWGGGVKHISLLICTFLVSFWPWNLTSVNLIFISYWWDVGLVLQTQKVLEEYKDKPGSFPFYDECLI